MKITWLPVGSCVCVLLAGLACGLAEPDSFEPNEDDPLAKGTVEVVLPAPHTVGYAETDVATIYLGNYFSHRNGEMLTYSTTFDTTKLDVRYAGAEKNKLVVKAKAIGEASLLIEASDERGRTAHLEFPFEVLDPCPRQPGPGEVDYYPMRVGDVRRYSLNYDDHNFYPVEIDGELVWETVSVSECVFGKSTYQVKSVVDATVKKYDPRGNVTETVVRRERDFSIVVGDSVRLSSFFDRPIPRIQLDSSPDTLQFSGAGTEAYVFESGLGLWGVYIRVVKNVGLVGRVMWTHYSSAGDLSEHVKLISQE